MNNQYWQSFNNLPPNNLEIEVCINGQIYLGKYDHEEQIVKLLKWIEGCTMGQYTERTTLQFILASEEHHPNGKWRLLGSYE